MQLFVNLLVNGVVEGLIAAMVALTIVVSYAVARFPNATAGDYVTAGAYTAYFTYTKLVSSVVAAAVSAGLAVATMSLTYYLVVYRQLSGKGFVAPLLASIGLAFFTRNTLTYFLGHDPIVFPTPLLRPLRWGPVLLQPIDLIIVASALLLLVALYLLMHKTGIGRDMRAIADDADLARVSGIHSGRVLAVVWITAGLVAGLCGSLLALRVVIDPESGWGLLLAGFAGAILGGLTSFPGAVIGSLMIGIVQELSVPFVGGSYKLMMPFAMILLVLLIRPTGLFGQRLRIR